MTSSNFSNNVVVITGASSGIGRELAVQLAAQRAKLVLAARNRDKLEEVAALCRKHAAEVLIVQTDVTSQEQCRNLIDQAHAQFGRIDTLINNAGISMWARFDELEDPSVAETIMAVNYFGSAYCSYYALPHLKKSRGRLVGISSLTGKVGVPTRSCYAASKHAMAGFFDSLRIELADSGVSVTMIYPGFVATDVRRNALGTTGRPLGETPVQEESVMTVQTCVSQSLSAIAERRRELVMTLKGKLGTWMKLLAPGVTDRLADKAIKNGR